MNRLVSWSGPLKLWNQASKNWNWTNKRNLGWLAKQKLARMEFYPSNRMIVLTEEPLESADSAVICFKFPFIVKNDAQLKTRNFYLQRQLDEDWLSTGRKIQEKVNLAKNANSRKMKKAKRTQENHSEVGEMNIWLSPNEETSGLSIPCGDTPLRNILEGHKLVRIEDADFFLCVNPPSIKKIKFALELIEGCPVIPSVDMESPSSSIHDVTWHWYTMEPDADPEAFSLSESLDHGAQSGARRFTPKGWSHRATGPVFTPQSSDVGKRILVIADPGPDSVAKAEISKEAVVKSDRPFIWSERQKECKEFCSGNEYRIVTYNVLADLYLDLRKPQEELHYPYCPKQFQKASYRYPLILQELSGYKPDIMCLQEVDNRLWTRYLKSYLQTLGYEGTFCLKGGQVNEGLTVFYRKNRFRWLENHDVFLSDLVSELRNPGINMDLKDFIEQDETLKSLVVTRPSALQVSILLEEGSKSIFVVANTHLHFAPSQTFVRIIQTALCTRHLEPILQHYRKEFPDMRVTLVWGADLNSLTENGSVEYLLDSKLGADHREWQGVGADIGAVNGINISHTLNLMDVCKDVPYSNFTKYEEDKGFAGRLDYILVDKADWKIEKVLPPPSLKELMKDTALPSEVAPSDHLPLIAHLSLKER